MKLTIELESGDTLQDVIDALKTSAVGNVAVVDQLTTTAAEKPAAKTPAKKTAPKAEPVKEQAPSSEDQPEPAKDEAPDNTDDMDDDAKMELAVERATGLINGGNADQLRKVLGSIGVKRVSELEGADLNQFLAADTA